MALTCACPCDTNFKTIHLGPVKDDTGGRLEFAEVQGTVQHGLVGHHPGWFYPTVGAEDYFGLERGRKA